MVQIGLTIFSVGGGATKEFHSLEGRIDLYPPATIEAAVLIKDFDQIRFLGPAGGNAKAIAEEIDQIGMIGKFTYEAEDQIQFIVMYD